MAILEAAALILTHTPDKACLSYQGVHCRPTFLCQYAAHGQPLLNLLNNLLFEKHLTLDKAHAGIHAVGPK